MTDSPRALLLGGIAAVVALGSLGLAAAQDFGPRQGGPQGGRGGPQMTSPLLTALDTNRDTTISPTEIDAAPASLKVLDKNNDGRIAGEELMPAFGPGGREGGGREGRGREGMPGNPNEPGETPATSPDELVALFMAFDVNKDGQLTKSEVPERMQGLFDRADANKDGKLNADEIRKSAAATPQPGARGGRGPGGMPGMNDRLVTALDTNKDGALSADEIANAPASLRMLDTNKDGQLTPDEYRNAGPGRGETHNSGNDNDERNC